MHIIVKREPYWQTIEIWVDENLHDLTAECIPVGWGSDLFELYHQNGDVFERVDHLINQEVMSLHYKGIGTTDYYMYTTRYTTVYKNMKYIRNHKYISPAEELSDELRTAAMEILMDYHDPIEVVCDNTPAPSYALAGYIAKWLHIVDCYTKPLEPGENTAWWSFEDETYCLYLNSENELKSICLPLTKRGYYLLGIYDPNNPLDGKFTCEYDMSKYYPDELTMQADYEEYCRQKQRTEEIEMQKLYELSLIAVDHVPDYIPECTKRDNKTKRRTKRPRAKIASRKRGVFTSKTVDRQ